SPLRVGTSRLLAMHVWVVIRNIGYSSFKLLRHPRAEFGNQLRIVVNPGSAATNERSIAIRRCNRRPTAIPETLANEGTSELCVLSLETLIEMEPVPMLNPLPIRATTVKVVSASLFP